MNTRFRVGVLAALLIVLLASALQAAPPANKPKPPPVNKLGAPGLNLQFQGFSGFPFKGMSGLPIPPGTGVFKGNININGQQQEFDNLDDFLNSLKNQNVDPAVIDFFQMMLNLK